MNLQNGSAPDLGRVEGREEAFYIRLPRGKFTPSLAATQGRHEIGLVHISFALARIFGVEHE